MKHIFVDGENPNLTVTLKSIRDVAWFRVLIELCRFKIDDGPFIEGKSIEFPISDTKLKDKDSASKMKHLADFCRALRMEKASVCGSLPSTVKDYPKLKWYVINLRDTSPPRRLTKKEVQAMK